MDDDLLAQGQDFMAALHAAVDAKPDGGAKDRAKRLAAVAHGALEALWQHAGDHGWVQPFDGTNKPPPGP